MRKSFKNFRNNVRREKFNMFSMKLKVAKPGVDMRGRIISDAINFKFSFGIERGIPTSIKAFGFEVPLKDFGYGYEAEAKYEVFIRETLQDILKMYRESRVDKVREIRIAKRKRFETKIKEGFINRRSLLKGHEMSKKKFKQMRDEAIAEHSSMSNLEILNNYSK